MVREPPPVESETAILAISLLIDPLAANSGAR
jgi:hypothetical protein